MQLKFFSAFIFARFFFINCSSSQCVAINNSVSAKILSNVKELSTNKLPVEEPIKILIPQTSFFLFIGF
jgi:hypothetical protein